MHRLANVSTVRPDFRQRLNDSPRKRWGWSLAVVSTATGLLLSVPAADSFASVVSHKSTSNTALLKKGLAYYRGKTLTFVAPDNPGGGYDQFTRAYAPYLAQYLHATVNVVNMGAGNTIAGQDYVAHAPANGLTIGWLNVAADVEDTILHLTGLNFNPVRVAMLGGTAPNAQVVIARTTPACQAWTSWSTVVRNSSASNQVSELSGLTGSTVFVLLLANGVFNVHPKLIFGYNSIATEIEGFTRGDGCVMVAPIAQVGPLIKGGLARPLLVSAPVPRVNVFYQYLAHTPTVAKAAKQLSKYVKTRLEKTAEVALVQAGTSAHVFFTASAVPSPEVAALRAAFKWASDNKGLQAKLITEGNPPGYISGPAEKSSYEVFLKSGAKAVPFLSAIAGGHPAS